MRFAIAIIACIVLVVAMVFGWAHYLPPRGASSPRDLAAASYVGLIGHDSIGNRLTVTWARDGGDVVTTSASGASDEVWFRADKMLVRSISGTISRFGHTALTWDEQLDRSALTGLPVPAAWMPHGSRYIASVGWTVGRAGLRWGSYARWWVPPGPLSESFVADRGPFVTPRFPAAPASAWIGRPVPGGVTASIDGHPVRVNVDTASGSLQISRRFAKRFALQISLFAGVFFWKTGPAQVAGLRAADPYATVGAGNEPDLTIPIGLFRGDAVAFDRGGHARVTARRCGQSGHAIDASSGSVHMPGSDSSSAPHFAEHYVTILNASWVGSRSVDGRSLPATVYIGRSWFAAKTLLVDLQSDRVCWYN